MKNIIRKYKEMFYRNKEFRNIIKDGICSLMIGFFVVFGWKLLEFIFSEPSSSSYSDSIIGLVLIASIFLNVKMYKDLKNR